MPDEKRVRVDGLPEGTDYRDDGCEYHPACLSCPFVVCRYDIRGGARTMLNWIRDEKMRQAKAAGASPDDIAAEFGVSRRSVFRVLQEQTR